MAAASSGANEPIALIGAAITLPAKIHDREKFFEIIRAKNQVGTCIYSHLICSHGRFRK